MCFGMLCSFITNIVSRIGMPLPVFTIKHLKRLLMQTMLHTSAYKKTVLSAENVVWFIAHLFIALFLYTALAKLINPPVFYGTLHASQLVKPFASFLTYAVPIVELLICIPLLFNEINVGARTIPTRKIGLLAGGVLMLSFTIYITVMLLLFGDKLPCSCGGFVKELTWPAHIVFNLAFVGLAIWALLLIKRMNKR